MGIGKERRNKARERGEEWKVGEEGKGGA